VCLLVSDSGIGMDTNTQRKAFDPFFTTKPVGQGTGFGLATVYSITKSCGGHTSIDSQLGVGTRVQVYLPLSDQEKSDLSPVSAATRTTGDEQILLVEDDSKIAALLERDLKKRGFNVLCAGDGQSALKLVRGLGINHIDLIVSDVIMPKMTGPAFVAQIRALGHSPAVLFISGYTADALAILGDQEVNLLPKPLHRNNWRYKYVRRSICDTRRKQTITNSAPPVLNGGK